MLRCSRLWQLRPMCHQMAIKASPSRTFFYRSGDPFYEMQRTMRNIEKVVDNFARDTVPPFASRFVRSFDPLWQCGSRQIPIQTKAADGSRIYKLQLNMDGFKPENIKVTVKDKLITIKSKYEETGSDGSKLSKDFTYEYSLPQEANSEKVQSRFGSDGILTIEAPLGPEKSTEIPVEKINSSK